MLDCQNRRSPPCLCTRDCACEVQVVFFSIDRPGETLRLSLVGSRTVTVSEALSPAAVHSRWVHGFFKSGITSAPGYVFPRSSFGHARLRQRPSLSDPSAGRCRVGSFLVEPPEPIKLFRVNEQMRATPIICFSSAGSLNNNILKKHLKYESHFSNCGESNHVFEDSCTRHGHCVLLVHIDLSVFSI